MAQNVAEAARRFVDVLKTSSRARAILSERDHVLDFEVLGGEPFHLSVRQGEAKVTVGPAPSTEEDLRRVTHFQGPAETLARLFQGEVGFSECFVPMNPEVPPLVLKELDMMMISGTINWFGRMARAARETLGRTTQEP